MRDQVETRLSELQREYRLGEERLRELTREEAVLRETLLRISGAIQVLEELTGAEAAEQAPAAAAARTAGEATRHPSAKGNRAGALTVP